MPRRLINQSFKLISFRERWSGIAPVNVRGVGESLKIVKQTGSGLGVDAQADPGGPSSPDLPLHIRPLRMTFVMGGNSCAGSRHRDITLSTKVSLFKAMVFPVVMYGCESWIIKTAYC